MAEAVSKNPFTEKVAAKAICKIAKIILHFIGVLHQSAGMGHKKTIQAAGHHKEIMTVKQLEEVLDHIMDDIVSMNEQIEDVIQ